MTITVCLEIAEFKNVNIDRINNWWLFSFIRRYFGSLSLIIPSCVNISGSSPGLFENLWKKHFDDWDLTDNFSFVIEE